MVKFIPSFTGNVTEEGFLTLLHPSIYRERLKKLSGKMVKLTLEEYTEIRTLPQNNRYHGALIRVIADELGYDHVTVHEIAKAKFLKRMVQCGDEMVEIVPSTTTLKKDEFTKYMQDVEVWAAELGIEITDNY